MSQQIIAKNREEAIAFAEGGNGHSQRTAYWKSGKKIYRAECLPGDREAAVGPAEGHWWSATKTVKQKIQEVIG